MSGINLTPSQATNEQTINPANSREQTLAKEGQTRRRIPMSIPRQKLSSPEIPGFYCHWMNDVAGRIEQAIQAGYEFVNRPEIHLSSGDLAGKTLGTGTDLGDRVSIVVGSAEDGSPLRAYLMKIRLEWYKEDQVVGQEAVDATDDAIRRGAQEAGDSAIDKQNRYVKRIERKSTYSRSA